MGFLHILKIFTIFGSVNQSVDIWRYLEEFRSSITRLEGNVAALTGGNARLNCRVETQNEEIRSLKSENASLREKDARYGDPEPPKDSGDSSVPRTKENIGAEIKRCTKSLRVKSGKKPGEKSGHEGNTRMKADSPETETHHPNFCRECGMGK